MKTNWPIKKLSEISETSSGVWGPEDSNGVGVIRSINFSNDGKIKRIDETAHRKIPSPKLEKALLKAGDILLEKSGGGPQQPVGRVLWFDLEDNKYTFGNFVQLIRPIDVESKYLFYYLLMFYQSGFTNRLQNQTTGIRNLKLKDYLNTDISVPPLKIQQKIVSRLEAIRKAQELNDLQISRTQELFESILGNEVETSSKWPKFKIGDITETITYGFSTAVASKIDGQGIPILTMAEIKDDGSIDYDKIRKIKVSKSEFQKFQLKSGDVLFNWRNASEKLIGKTAIFDRSTPTVYASFLLKIIPKSILNNYFLFYYLNYLRKKSFLENYMKQQANHTINASDLKKIEITIL